MKTRDLGLGTWITIGSPVVTEVVSNYGFDWLLFDLEHGCMSEEGMIANMQAVRGAETKIIVRVGELRHSLIGHALDYGAAGIMLPHVENAATAREALEAMYYPPYGDRGLSTSARSFGFGSRVPKDIAAMERPLFMTQIESYDGVMNAEEIAAVEGVDVLFVGPRDLGYELSVRPAEKTMEMDEALQRVAAAASKHGKQAGILVRNVADLPKLREYGYTALAAGSDLGMLRAGYRELLKNFQ